MSLVLPTTNDASFYSKPANRAPFTPNVVGVVDRDDLSVHSDNNDSLFVTECHIDQLKMSSITHLAHRGVQKILYPVADHWREVDITTPFKRCSIFTRRFFRQLNTEIKLGALAIGEYFRTVARRTALRWFGTDLPTAAKGKFRKDRGHCYTLHIPKLQQFADSVGIERDYHWLFENGHRLTMHTSHDDIRALGGGLCTHWETDIYLSSRDGSDPNLNRRRYSIIYIHNRPTLQSWLAWSRPLSLEMRKSRALVGKKVV